MSEEELPVVLRVMDRGRGRGPDPLRVTEATGASVMLHPRHKLRLLRRHRVTFIRGPRDRSPWREAGRAELHRKAMPPKWNQAEAGFSESPRSRVYRRNQMVPMSVLPDAWSFSGRGDWNR
ncbi:hypothetical protein [Salinithrix halophila]|uniref:Uncharacterized protein n=1 Tax=Salinithrix halophila TaxID=1485204 RepID=A0ABV8JHJ1_9BACL